MRYYEIKLFELNDKVKDNLRFKFKRENQELTDAQIDYYLDRWDRFSNTFDSQYRDITRLTFAQVEQLIDDAETKTQLKGTAKPARVFDQNDDLIYNKNNLVILKGDIREKCIQYGDGYSWCISRKDASNMFYSYRMRMNEPMFYFVFDKDLPSENIWHAVVIYVDNQNIFHVATSNNPGDVEMTWGEIVSKKPKLSGLESLFVHQPLTAEEKADYKKYGRPVDLATYKNFSLKGKYKYIQFGHRLSDEQQDATPNELIGVYAKQMPINISENTWNRLNPSDKRKVEEGQLTVIEENPEAIERIKNPSERVQKIAYAKMLGIDNFDNMTLEQLQLQLIQRYRYAIDYIKNPSERVHKAAYARLYGIDDIDNMTLEQVQLAAIQKNGNVISYIDNPNERIQLAAVQQNPDLIAYIVDKGITPSETVQLATVRQNPEMIYYIKNPSEAVQLAAVQQDGTAIKYINNPSEEVQLAAVQHDGYAIKYIIQKGITPSDAVRRLAAKRQLEQ